MLTVVKPDTDNKQLYRLVDPEADARFDQRMLKDPEEKQYLVCLLMEYSDDVIYEWNLIRGRKAAYEYLQENIEEINLEESFILTEGVKLEDRKTSYAFMKYCQSIFNDGFDIDNYVEQPMEATNTTRIVDGTFTDLLDGRRELTMSELMQGADLNDRPSL